ncbi:type II-A CRISPR-associated protein Csn2 [Lactobacillus psittaci]|uniref:CRISPR-associated protein n=1 Tax=Lactobacillus psittaci DSM 15354 TaxID=1122152 RepID=A0A0R1S3L4_9LACO|nr:type II-A CRISPR-associated protein Csn2 [Lactobacillus psittaci]KRL63521.1 CRISPR-associated protein [Lactobacillus psittaci DSM 15354]
MIISYEGHHPIEVEDGKVTIIKVANPNVYRDFILSFQEKSGKVKIFDKQYSQIEINKAIDWVGDPLITKECLNNYLTKVMTMLFDGLDEEHRNQIFNTWQKLNTDIQDAIFMSDLPIEVGSNNVDIKKLFKFDGIHFDNSVLSDPYDIIETVVKIHIECKLKSAVAFANVSHYLTKEQLHNLITFINEVNVPLILIEFSSPDFQVVSGDVSVCYIDEDFVDWY